MTRAFHVQLTMDRVRCAPSIDTEQSISRQQEADLSDHYDYPSYWGLGGVWGLGESPAALSTGVGGRVTGGRIVPPGDRHLRSMNELRGYHVIGSDGELGHVDDFLVDEVSWEVRYFVIDTSTWWPDSHVLIAPVWAHGVSWKERRLYFHKTREAIRDAPEWHRDSPPDPDYEAALRAYYDSSAAADRAHPHLLAGRGTDHELGQSRAARLLDAREPSFTSSMTASGTTDATPTTAQSIHPSATVPSTARSGGT